VRAAAVQDPLRLSNLAHYGAGLPTLPSVYGGMISEYADDVVTVTSVLTGRAGFV